MENANLLLSEGKSLHRIGQGFLPTLWIIGIVGFLITTICCGEYRSGYLLLSGHYPFVNVLMGLWYLLIGVGSLWLPAIVFGLILIGIGQIASNTCTEEPLNSSCPVECHTLDSANDEAGHEDDTES